jgi:cob(I)alamin adenosyltransferase
MIHIYYGFGKGKTSALNGSILRAKGAGFKPIVFRFLKGRKTSEDQIIKSLDIPIYSNHPSEKFVIQMNEVEKKEAHDKIFEQLQQLQEQSKYYDFIVLDEILDIVYLKFLTQEALIKILKSINKDKEILISGHYKLDKVFEFVDLITHFESEKHYFKKQKARKGIEY